MKKGLGRILVALLLAGMLCATMAPAIAGAEKIEGVTLTFVASQNWVNKAGNVDDVLNQKFEEETGIKIDMQMVPDDQYANVLKTKMSTGEVPDIFMVSGGVGAEKYLPEKYFADLSDEPWVDRYVEYARQGTTINGKVMGLMTWCVDGWAILYNPELYAQYGLSAPTSFDAFKTVCQTLLDNGITPIYEIGKESWHWAVWFSQVGPYAASKHEDLYGKLNRNEIEFADIPEFEQFLAEFKEVYDLGYLGEYSLANPWDAAYEVLGTGGAAGFLAYQSYQHEVMDKYPESDAGSWEMYPIPFAGNNMYSHSAGGNMRVAYKDSPNLEYVKMFFEFLARPDNLQIFYDGRGDLQTAPSFADVEAKPTTSGKSVVENAPGGQGMDLEYGVMYWDNTQVGIFIQEMMLGNKTPAEVLEAIDGKRQEMFDAISKS
ncbi:MAG: carbohydrate ABC transporter substrate-binding protein [Clostridiales bacterium]|nr:carbohydrate ABC transporter substrate-binding protein [Clostridiales bacterium]